MKNEQVNIIRSLTRWGWGEQGEVPLLVHGIFGTGSALGYEVMSAIEKRIQACTRAPSQTYARASLIINHSS